jgi:hypothetical protein
MKTRTTTDIWFDKEDDLVIVEYSDFHAVRLGGAATIYLIKDRCTLAELRDLLNNAEIRQA